MTDACKCGMEPGRRKRMIVLHSGRDNIDKEKYIYSEISDRAFVLVPNQYTLVAEEQALRYTGKSCLFGIEILSINRLGQRLLKEKGQESITLLSRNGRNMLLAKIVRRNRDRLELFRQPAGKTTFTEMIADFISEFKQQGLSLREIRSLSEDESVNSVMRKKLSELSVIFDEYEKEIDGRYIDGEDYIDRYIEAAGSSELAKGKQIWIYGYDTITPKMLKFIIELEKTAESVNMIVNEGDYGLGEHMRSMFQRACVDSGTEYEFREIPRAFEAKRIEAIEAIGREFASSCPKEYEGEADGVRLTECANQYYEAEAAASYVLELLRDYEYKMKDITILCNDKDRLQPVIKRTFEEYGLDIFVDSSRRITDCAPVCFIAANLSLIRFPFSTDNIITLMKTGMSGLNRDMVSKLEIYAEKYNIRGRMWTKPFRYGGEEYGDEAFRELEESRAYIGERLEHLESLTGESCEISSWISSFRDYLEEDWQFSLRAEEHIRRQEEAGLLDDALRTSGSVKEAVEVFDQLNRIMGGEAFDRDEVCEILEAGLTSVSIGIIPPSSDGIAMGTIVRTRPRPARAVLVLGANEGSIPLQPSVEGLFSVEEKSVFKKNGWPLGSLDDIKMMEENTAVHRMLSKPTERLYVSYSLTDTSGQTLLPSGILQSLKDVLPALKTEKDVVSRGFGIQLVNYRQEAIKHLVNHLKDRNLESGDSLSAAMLRYFEENEPELTEQLLGCAMDENRVEELGQELAGRLWGRGGSFVMSASGIQSYRECPFRFFVDRGLRPYEDRPFTSDSRSIGDICHECMMKVGEKVIEGSDEEVAVLVDEVLGEISITYRDGLFKSTRLEGYRLECIREVCIAAAKAMAAQLRCEAVVDAAFEEKFGRRRSFPALELEVDGVPVRIEGIIDRADLLSGDKVRVIDYKTGADRLDLNKLRKGYRMQLMIYLMSASGKGYEPAGMFYFNISRNEENADRMTSAKLEALEDGSPEDSFKLRGLCIGGDESLDLMPRSVLAGRRPPVITNEEFMDLRKEVEEKLAEAASGIVSGAVSISPVRESGTASACRYCRYRGICRYDAAAYRGNRPRLL